MKIIYNPYPEFNPETLKRSEAMQKEYQEHLESLGWLKVSPTEEVLKQEFQSKSQRIAIVKNKFPYDLPEGMEHWLLWVNSQVFQEMEEKTKNQAYKKDVIENYVRGRVLEFFDFENIVCIFENEPKDQSVQGLKHWHIILTKN